MRPPATVAVTGAAAVAAIHLLPSVLTVPSLHRRLAVRLSGRSPLRHVALTFDDGPSPTSTPLVLDALRRLDVRATFFLLGSEVAAHPEVARDIVAAGHEVAVHGWAHVPHVVRTPHWVRTDVRRAVAVIADTTGIRPAFWRPPNGVITGTGLLSAHRAGLQPVLWTADGRDWCADADGDSVLARLSSQLDAGGTVLLHDSDVRSAPRSWRAALAGLPGLVAMCQARGWPVGPLREHWPTMGC